jgi:hypothetical protein
MATPIEKFEYSSHVIKRMSERGISKAQMEDAVSNPESRKQQYHGTHGGIVWQHGKKQQTGKTLDVVAELYKSSCYFVTVFYEEEDFRTNSRRGEDAASR